MNEIKGTNNPYHKGDLQDECHRYTIFEFLVHCLVMPHFHTAPRANATVYDCK